MSHKIEGSTPVGATVRTSATSAVSSSGSERSAVTTSADSRDRLSLTGEATQLQSLARSLHQAPVVDEARVQSVKEALNNGSYKIDDQAIANRMLTLDQQLGA